MTVQEIKKYMKQNKITYDELAARASLSVSTIKKIFSGISQYPRIDTMQAIERALGLDVPKEQELSDEEKQLVSLIAKLTDEEVKELSNFVDYIISKRK